MAQTSWQTLTPDLDLVLPTDVPAKLDWRSGHMFSVDAKSGDLVIVEQRDCSTDQTACAIVSYTEVGNNLVFGAKSSITTATPACSGN